MNLKKNTNAYNTVYVGVKGTPETHEINAPQMVSSIPKTERVAEKPFLVEEMGHWFVSAGGSISEASFLHLHRRRFTFCYAHASSHRLRTQCVALTAHSPFDAQRRVRNELAE